MSVLKKTITKALQNIKLPKEKSHKGQNGKLLIIGGSNLFHSASKWSLDVASRFVDMVFYCSTPQNNNLIKESKKHFTNGIVVERHDLEAYIKEADCILIGPGMERSKKFNDLINADHHGNFPQPTNKQWQDNTQKIVNYLLNKYQEKKWVIDGGALQMVCPSLINKHCILTPHGKEFKLITHKTSKYLMLQYKKESDKSNKIKIGVHEWSFQNGNWLWPYENSFDEVSSDEKRKQILKISVALNESTIIKKGHVDYIFSQKKQKKCSQKNIFAMHGGNSGMIKGGTGDVLAGLVAGLYCNHDAMTSSIVGSYINKKAADTLYKKVGPFFNATDLANEIAPTFWKELKNCN